MNISFRDTVDMFNERNPKKRLNLNLIEVSVNKLKPNTHDKKKREILKRIEHIIHKEKRNIAAFGDPGDDDNDGDDDDDENMEGDFYFKHDLNQNHNHEIENQHNYENQNRKFSINGQPISIQPFDTNTDMRDTYKFGDSTGILVRHS